MGAPDNTNYAIFTLGSATTDVSTISGASTITGDIGLAGSGNLNFSGASTITGNVYDHTTGTFRPSGGATQSGTKYQSMQTDAPLNQGVIDAKNASTAAKNLGLNDPAATSGTINSTNGNLSLTASNGKFIMNLTDLVLSNTTLTLTGSSTDYFVFNISNNFSLSKSSIIQLSGGLTANNVLFNYLGGSTISLGTSSQLTGIILAASTTNYTNSLVSMSGGAKVTGEIIADKVSISGGATVTAIVSP